MHKYSLKLQGSRVTSLWNNKSFLDLVCSFKLGLFNAIYETSRILKTCLFSGAANKIFHKSWWLKFFLKCFAGLESSELSSCSHSSQTSSSSHTTHAECGYLLFSPKSCFIFFVINFFLISYKLLVRSWNLLVRHF